jgi:hypothetical protein
MIMGWKTELPDREIEHNTRLVGVPSEKPMNFLAYIIG